ncbi:MAG: hypothetical protein K9N49_09245 [Candidatus Marinimicrobia bacterium]|nr:hypothetical protein [Candidatus Neomarinimicrobiota bacterium]
MNATTNEAGFQIEAPGVDVEALMAEIAADVAAKQARGVYQDARIARAERSNLAQLQGEEQFLGFYLACLREAVYIDISDFEIRERRAALAPLLVRLKQTIWKLLKFYTYRLWSQQNEVNGMLVTALEGLDDKYRDRLAALEKRVAELEAHTP